MVVEFPGQFCTLLQSWIFFHAADSNRLMGIDRQAAACRRHPLQHGFRQHGFRRHASEGVQSRHRPPSLVLHGLAACETAKLSSNIWKRVILSAEICRISANGESIIFPVALTFEMK
jgi:hypothetical protein